MIKKVRDRVFRKINTKLQKEHNYTTDDHEDTLRDAISEYMDTLPLEEQLTLVYNDFGLWEYLFSYDRVDWDEQFGSDVEEVNMTTYLITVEFTQFQAVIVEADNPEEAKFRALRGREDGECSRKWACGPLDVVEILIQGGDSRWSGKEV